MNRKKKLKNTQTTGVPNWKRNHKTLHYLKYGKLQKIYETNNPKLATHSKLITSARLLTKKNPVHFHTKFSVRTSHNNITMNTNFKISLDPVTSSEIQTIISRLPTPSRDKITNQMMKNCNKNIVGYITAVANDTYRHHMFPTKWKTADQGKTQTRGRSPYSQH